MKTTAATKKNQRGLSLVEVMIGLLLSLVLTAGVIQIYISNKQTYTLQDEMSRLQENGRFAMDIVQRVIRGAGFQGGQAFIPANTMDAANPPNQYDPANTLVTTSSNDHLEVIGSSWVDCAGIPLGTPPPPAVPVTNFFYIDQNNNLVCLSSSALVPRILIDNVERMEILYGVDTDGDQSADNYQTATQVAGGGSWPNVVSVRIALLLSTSTDEARSRIMPQPMTLDSVAANPLLSTFGVNQGNPRLFDSNNDGLADTNVAQDTRLYRVFTTTVALRNRVP